MRTLKEQTHPVGHFATKEQVDQLFQKPGVLSGHIEEISMMELRERVGQAIQQVELGKTFILVSGRNRRRVGVLQPLPGETLTIYVDKDGKPTYTPPQKEREDER